MKRFEYPLAEGTTGSIQMNRSPNRVTYHFDSVRLNTLFDPANETHRRLTLPLFYEGGSPGYPRRPSWPIALQPPSYTVFSQLVNMVVIEGGGRQGLAGYVYDPNSDPHQVLDMETFFPPREGQEGFYYHRYHLVAGQIGGVACTRVRLARRPGNLDGDLNPEIPPENDLKRQSLVDRVGRLENDILWDVRALIEPQRKHPTADMQIPNLFARHDVLYRVYEDIIAHRNA